MSKFSDYFEAQKKSKIKAGDGLAVGKYKFFNSSNIQTKFYNEALYNNEALIFGTGGNASIHYCNEPFSTSTDCIVFFAKRNDFNVKLVYQYLLGNIHILQNGFKGAGIKHISKGYIEDIELNLPILEQQHQIASTLDKVTHTIDLCNQIIEKLDLLVKARFVEMFGDIVHMPKYRMIDLTDISDIGSSKRIYADEYVDYGIPFYRSKEIRELGSGARPSIELFITIERYESIKEKYGVPKIGDILIAAIGATIGYTWIVNTAEPFYYKDGNLIILSVKDNINSVYLNHAINIIINEFKSAGASGSAQLALTIEKLQKIKISYPPVTLQNQFANFAEHTEKSKSAVKKVLEKAKTLKKALMQEYFR